MKKTPPQGRNDSAMLRSLKKLFTATTLRAADSYASFCMHEMMLCKTIATENSSPMVLQVLISHIVYLI